MTGSTRLRTAVLISGTGTNLQAIIDARDSGQLNIDIVGVLSDRPHVKGLQRAADADIHTEIIDYKRFARRADFDSRLAEKLAALQPDLIVLAGYMRILPEETVSAYTGRMLNVHPSLLPAYPGLDTYARALAAGETWHGTTVHFVTPKVDAGPPVLQYRLRIKESDTEPELRERVQQGEHLIYPRAIEWFADGRLKLDNGQVILDGKQLTTPAIVESEE
jgi:phosphoribosylglycinamide formyltransferase-1